MPDETDVTPNGVSLTDWNDVAFKRKSIFDGVKDALQSKFPVTYNGVRAELSNTRYEGPEDVSLADQKDALLGNTFLHRKLRGTVNLVDAKDGTPLDSKDLTLMRVPYMTDRHTFIHNGSEYSTMHQARLLPGVYTRRKANGEFESHFNAQRGTGPSFRVRLEPDTGLFKVDIGQSSLRLYSLLHDLGVADDHLEKTWGPELLAKNKAAYDSRVFDKAFMRLVRRPPPDMTREQKAQAIKDALAATKLNRKVLERTLPNRFNTKLASQWRKQAFTNSTSASPTSSMKISPKVRPPAEDYLGRIVFNQDTQDNTDEEFNRADYLMLAQLLNEKFHARIPMDTPSDQLAGAIDRAMEEIMPGVNKDMLAETFKAQKEAKSANSLGCLMATLTSAEAAPIVAWSKEHIKEKNLALDGIEQAPHVTVKYGFKAGFNSKRLVRLLKDFGPVRLTLKDVTRFRDVQDGKADAIIVAVESPDLVRLNKLIEEEFSDSFDAGLTRRTYKPHLTLAYVLPGSAKDLDGHAWFAGNTYVLNNLMFKSYGGKDRIDVALVEA